jgi:hypothetical protein
MQAFISLFLCERSFFFVKTESVIEGSGEFVSGLTSAQLVKIFLWQDPNYSLFSTPLLFDACEIPWSRATEMFSMSRRKVVRTL